MSEHVEGRSQGYVQPSGPAWNAFGILDQQSGGRINRLPAGLAVLVMLLLSAALWAVIILGGMRALHFL